MKVLKEDSGVIRGGEVGAETNFSIAMNSKMFRLLSDTMYSDKIGSIVREITSNAIDGHTKAGEPEKPYTIHVPDAIEPYFSVKDEGVGMSDEDIRTIYTTYGASTKDDSNDFIGAFGLGSKTPFAYVQQFDVTSIHGGVKRMYNAAIGDDGTPTITCYNEEKTSEHSGVEVTIGVNPADFREFHQAIRNQLRFRKVKPVLENNRAGVKIPDIFSADTMWKSDTAIVFQNNYDDNALSGVWIVQGGVGYPLNSHNLNDMTEDQQVFLQSMTHQGAAIFFDIGDIDVTGNREDISYIKPTIESIKKRLTELANEMSKQIRDEVAKEKTGWKRAELYSQQPEIMRRAIRNMTDFAKLFAGFDLKNQRYANMIMDSEPLLKSEYQFVMVDTRQNYRRGSHYTSFVRNTVGAQQSKSSWSNEVHQLVVYPATKFVVRDTKKQPVARLKHFVDNDASPQTILIERKDGANIEKKDHKKIAALLRIATGDLIKLDDLPVPPKNSNSSTYHRPTAYKMPTNQNHRYIEVHNSSDWETIVEPLDELEPSNGKKLYYIVMDRHSMQFDSNGPDGNSRDYNMFTIAMLKKLIPAELISVPVATGKRIREGKIDINAEHWTAALSEIHKLIEDKKHLVVEKERWNTIINMVSEDGELLNHAKHPMARAIKHARKKLKKLERCMNNQTIKEMCVSAAYEEIQQVHQSCYTQFQQYEDFMSEQYPLLPHVSWGWRDDKKKAVEAAIEYIQLMNEKNQKGA